MNAISEKRGGPSETRTTVLPMKFSRLKESEPKSTATNATTQK